jgi:LacI family sucrose operon transcriptional repressor
MPTIKDVAKRAGVSVTTVSRVMNNRGYLSAEMKKKVTAAIKELDFHPNDLARSLHRQKSYIIGLIVPSVQHPYFGALANYIEGYAYDAGYKVLICNSLQEKAKELDYITMLKRSQVDGIIMGSHVADTSDYTGLNLPIISLDRRLGPGIPYICGDNYRGGELATLHLIEQGCKRLIHFCSGIRIEIVANWRTQAFFDICKKENITHLHIELPESSLIDFKEQEIIRNTLIIHPECDGVFASNDITALAVISIAAGMGRKIGDDLKVIGYDGSFFTGFTKPRISTIRQPVNLMSRYAVEYLIRQMSGEEVPSQTMLNVELVAGESTLGNEVSQG